MNIGFCVNMTLIPLGLLCSRVRLVHRHGVLPSLAVGGLSCEGLIGFNISALVGAVG